MIEKVNHIAIAVPDLDAAIATYRDTLGAPVSQKQALPEHGVTVVFVELGNTKVELLEPLGETSPITSFLDKNPSGGMHHICYEVADILMARDRLKASAPVSWVMASRRSAPMVARSSSCTPRISTARWSNWKRFDERWSICAVR